MKILLVSSRFPLPPWRGNQLRTLQWLEALDDCERFLVCPAGQEVRLPPEFGVELVSTPLGTTGLAIGLASALFAGRPVQEGIYDTSAARKRLAEAVVYRRPDVVVVQMVRCGWAVDVIESACPGLPVVFDSIDCMSLHYSRAASRLTSPLRQLNSFEAGRCKRRESELVQRSAVTTAVSRRDLDALAAGPRGRVVTVAGGVEIDGQHAGRREPVVLLSGNLGYAPTVRAARWFADRVWPSVRAKVPGARWILAGARPARHVKRLASRPGVEIHGDVDDLAPFLARAAVAIAPMASGSGVPIKILEAMAAKVPVVADPWSAAGLVDPGAVATAGDEAEWIETIQEILTDDRVAGGLTARASELWRASYRSEVVKTQIRDAVEAAVQESV